MNGLGGLNKSPNGVVIGVVQSQLPVVVTPADLKAQCAHIVAMVGKARRNMATMDLVVFPEYSLHGLSMDMNREIVCSSSLWASWVPQMNRTLDSPKPWVSMARLAAAITSGWEESPR